MSSIVDEENDGSLTDGEAEEQLDPSGSEIEEKPTDLGAAVELN